MKKTSTILLLIGMVMAITAMSRVTATSNYVGVAVGDKYDFTATFEYEVNDTGNLTAKVDFTLEILELQPEANNPTWGDYTPVVFSIAGTWGGTNVTLTPLNETLKKITGAEFNTSFSWNDTIDVYDSHDNKYLPSSPKFAWLIPIVTGSRTVTLDSSTEDATTSWDEKGVMVLYSRSSTIVNATTGTTEREEINITLKSTTDPALVIGLSIFLASVGVFVVAMLIVMRKKGMLKLKRKSAI